MSVFDDSPVEDHEYWKAVLEARIPEIITEKDDYDIRHRGEPKPRLSRSDSFEFFPKMGRHVEKSHSLNGGGPVGYSRVSSRKRGDCQADQFEDATVTPSPSSLRLQSAVKQTSNKNNSTANTRKELSNQIQIRVEENNRLQQSNRLQGNNRLQESNRIKTPAEKQEEEEEKKRFDILYGRISKSDSLHEKTAKGKKAEPPFSVYCNDHDRRVYTTMGEEFRLAEWYLDRDIFDKLMDKGLNRSFDYTRVKPAEMPLPAQYPQNPKAIFCGIGNTDICQKQPAYVAFVGYIDVFLGDFIKTSRDFKMLLAEKVLTLIKQNSFRFIEWNGQQRYWTQLDRKQSIIRILQKFRDRALEIEAATRKDLSEAGRRKLPSKKRKKPASDVSLQGSSPQKAGPKLPSPSTQTQTARDPHHTPARKKHRTKSFDSGTENGERLSGKRPQKVAAKLGSPSSRKQTADDAHPTPDRQKNRTASFDSETENGKQVSGKRKMSDASQLEPARAPVGSSAEAASKQTMLSPQDLQSQMIDRQILAARMAYYPTMPGYFPGSYPFTPPFLSPPYLMPATPFMSPYYMENPQYPAGSQLPGKPSTNLPSPDDSRKDSPPKKR
eukprot:scaffold867_cov112-Cylindrotheca_fusiformis.AAC.3